MDKYSIVQKTLIALVLATMVLAVAIPLLFFTSTSFSNSVEISSSWLWKTIVRQYSGFCLLERFRLPLSSI